MKFSRLRLSGFKSFVEPTEFHIEDGLTGVVGPNGCGKSNLVEALRWVMGETSAKQMRGGEMDDVIFGGTSDRPARNLAEVVLSLDNGERGAPAQFNDTDELDVTRRIERGGGSTYKVNGREVRARDVQLLFADAASGARSTALVSQGRIGAVINAKPTDRRHLLEEAAGITGLHSRRHEAELRLRAAEANLERLDDVIAALEDQLRVLKRQARQATRYRNLSDRIRKAEAVVLHSRWREALAARDEAAAALREADRLVAESTAETARETTRREEAAAALPGLRQAEAEAAAALQRLLVARDALEAEERRHEAAQAENATRLAQIAADTEREQSLGREAAAAIDAADRESEDIRVAQAGEAAVLESAMAEVTDAGARVEETEERLTELTREVAAEEARAQSLAQQIAELESRHGRLMQRREAALRERGALAGEGGDGDALEQARAAVTAADAALETASGRYEAAEQARIAAQATESESRSAHQVGEAEVARLRAEVAALEELVAVGDTDLFPPLIDALSVTPGYEMALGAALGDDLTAPLNEAAPIHWRSLDAATGAPALPRGAEPLSNFVTAPPALQRRLSQIGVVANDDAGTAALAALAQGQRLVSRDGSMWRWDGYTVSAGAPTPAAIRLTQINRLADLRDALGEAERRAGKSGAALEAAHADAARAADAERELRDAARSADRELQQARNQEAKLARESAQRLSRLEALAEAAAQLEADAEDVAASLADARAAAAGLPDLAERREAVETRRGELTAARSEFDGLRRAHDQLAHESQIRARRLDTLATERTMWQERAANAERQLEQLAERRADADAEAERLAAQPAQIAAQRDRLLDGIGAAETRRNRAADELATAETRLEDVQRELRQAEARLAERREERVRRSGLVDQVATSMEGLAERVRERLRCAPDRILEVAGIDPEKNMPDRESMEITLDRLVRERDNMGPVNLRAEAEASEMDERIVGMQGEREDLLAAIAKLRQGISGLNREGRERLLAAFGEVDRHFQELFTRLFGGGHAHLSLTEADDPLEAGLEIMASPPGKRLQNMSLMSGGEQALSALALLFAVFLTNPAPICVLDEVDAPLDDHNVDRFCDMLHEMAHNSKTRFLLITHHRLTMARMDRLYGVTMAERGVSQLVSVDLSTAEQMRESA